MADKNQNFEFIKMAKILYALAKLFSEVQQDLYRKNLDSVNKFRKFNATGFSLKDKTTRLLDASGKNDEKETISLLDMISFQTYQISELIIEFPVIEKDNHHDKPDGTSRFYFVVPPGERNMSNQVARIKIEKREHIIAEFQIDEEIRESFVLN